MSLAYGSISVQGLPDRDNAVDDVRSLVIKAGTPSATRQEPLAAFQELVTRFQDMAYGYAYTILGDFHLAQDAAQEAGIKAFLRLGDLREPRAFAPWLRLIVRTVCDHMLRRKQVSSVPLTAAEGIPAPVIEPDVAGFWSGRNDSIIPNKSLTAKPKRQPEFKSRQHSGPSRH